MVTVVSCYYRIPSKYSHEKYEKWISNFMQLDMNSIIFGDRDSIGFLKHNYPENDKRKYVLREFNEFINFKYDWEKEVSLNYKPHAGHNPKLFMIWCEKIHFVNEAINLNPYNSSSFVWMDIGCVRDEKWLPCIKGFPNDSKFNDNKVNFLKVNDRTDYNIDDAKLPISSNFLRKIPLLGGTIYAGGIKALQDFRELFMSVIDEADKNNVFKGEDQDLYSLCAVRKPELFKLYEPLNIGYDKWFSLHLYWSNMLRIDIVGPGIMPIPPKGWGAVEILIWDIAEALRKEGHFVRIHNTKDLRSVVESIKKSNPDFVHIQYDDHAHIASEIAPYTKAVAITSHYGYLEQKNRWGGYINTFKGVINQTAENIYHFVLSDGIKRIYESFGVDSSKIFVTPNGADDTLFRYTTNPAYPDRSIVVGKLEHRKGQWRLQNTPNIWFAGNRGDDSLPRDHPCSLGEWDKPTLYNNLTDYANLILLSDGEADPLVVKEALMVGLGIVVSTHAAANLDVSLPFITVIPDDRINDQLFVNQEIEKNRSISSLIRPVIKEYARNFTWTNRVNEYLSIIKKLINYKATSANIVKPDSHKENYYNMYPELNIFKSFRQIVIWGFPLHTHTHSYIHGAWKKAFDYLGLKTYWFHDADYPNDFDWSNTLFITEGWADDNIPIHPSSTYFVHIAKDPSKYIDKGVRLIEIRYNVKEIHDFNYDYKFPDNPFFLSNHTFYEVVEDDSAVASRRGRNVQKKSYEVIYMHWATDLLPHEINFEDAKRTRENKNYFIGSLCKNHPLLQYKNACETRGIETVIIDPWSHPISFDENIELMKRSFAAPDFRSVRSQHLESGYIPCRVLKAISYGQTGFTNSIHVKELLGEHVLYVDDPCKVIDLTLEYKDRVEWRQRGMKYIAENHTYIQRIRDLARAINMKTTPTIVSALYDIGRNVVDGQSMSNYVKCTQKTLFTICNPIILFLDKKLNIKKDFLELRNSVGPIKVIETDLSEIQMFNYKHSVEEILDSTEFKMKQKYPNDLTNKLAMYSIFVFNKFHFIEESLKNSIAETFVWIDPDYLSSPYYNNSKQYKFKDCIINKFVIKTEKHREFLIKSLKSDEYIGTNERILGGEIFICPRKYATFMKTAMMKVWDEEMIFKNRIDNEQIGLALICNKFTDLFELCDTVFDKYFM
jgi:hypothetical protein